MLNKVVSKPTKFSRDRLGRGLQLTFYVHPDKKISHRPHFWHQIFEFIHSSELRDKNFNAVGPTLSRKARAISSAFEERHGAKTVQEFKTFVDKLPQMQSLKQSLATHTSIAELVKEKTDTSSFLEFLQIGRPIASIKYSL